MTGTTIFDDDLVRRLPLPLAQLYRSAYNSKTNLQRHNAACFLWEAALKLLGSTAIVAYAERSEPAPDVCARLEHLARPSNGHWWEFVRLLLPLLAQDGDAGFQSAHDLILGRGRNDWHRAASLDAALHEVLEGSGGPRKTIRLQPVFDRLVQYRNSELGHGATGQAAESFYERMGWALLLGVTEILRRLDVLAGRRLISVADVHFQCCGTWLIERYELTGEAPRRLDPLERPESEVARLPRPQRLYLQAPESATGAETVPGWPLHPLLLYEHETGDVFFFNGRSGERKIEYLDYHRNRKKKGVDLDSEQRTLLAQALNIKVDAAPVEWSAMPFQADVPPVPLREQPERSWIGEFELLSELGRGDIAVVYRAWQPSLDRPVALKCFIRPGDTDAERRFDREIRSLSQVEHPNLVKVFTSGAEADQWFYARELIEGATLGSVCGRLRREGVGASDLGLETWHTALITVSQEARAAELPLSPPGEDEHRATVERPLATTVPLRGRNYVQHVVELVRQTADAAHALHEAGVIHRAIKPDNILVTPDGTQAVLMDLGLAQLAEESDGHLTLSRQSAGTLRYASPEQFLPVPIDRRTDVYSLGATLWELLTLRPLFDATDKTPASDLTLKIQQADPEHPRHLNPRVPDDLQAIVLKCLEKDRTRRYGTAQDLADDLGRWLRGESVMAEVSSTGRLVRRLLRETRHTEVLTLWAQVWIWHAFQVFLLFLASSALIAKGYQDTRLYVALWVTGLFSLLIPVWYYRFRGGPALTPIERILREVWGIFAIGSLLLVLSTVWPSHEHPPVPREVTQLLQLVVLVSGMGAGCMAAILRGSFYLMAAASAVLALFLPSRPAVSSAVFGAVFAVSLFIPGWKHSRRRGLDSPTRTRSPGAACCVQGSVADGGTSDSWATIPAGNDSATVHQTT
jgi:serine/threonine protein kinase